MCPLQTRVSLGPPELAVPEKTELGGEHLGRKTDRGMPAGKAGVKEFGTTGGVLIEADRSNYRPAKPAPRVSANGRAGSPDPAIQSPALPAAECCHNTLPTKFLRIEVPEADIPKEKPSAFGRRRKGGSGRPATGGAEVALRRSAFPPWMGRLLQPKTQIQNSEPGAGGERGPQRHEKQRAAPRASRQGAAPWGRRRTQGRTDWQENDRTNRDRDAEG